MFSLLIVDMLCLRFKRTSNIRNANQLGAVIITEVGHVFVSVHSPKTNKTSLSSCVQGEKQKHIETSVIMEPLPLESKV